MVSPNCVLRINCIDESELIENSNHDQRAWERVSAILGSQSVRD